MKLERNNKYSGKKLLNSLKIMLLSSTLLMGCNSVKAEEIKEIPTMTPIITSTPIITPTPTIAPTAEPTATPTISPQKTREEAIEALNIPKNINMEDKYSFYDISVIAYVIEETPKIALIYFKKSDGDYIIYNYLNDIPMFSIAIEEVIHKQDSEIDITKFTPLCFEYNEGVEVINIGSFIYLEKIIKEMGIECGESEYSKIVHDESFGGMSFGNIVNYYLDIIPDLHITYSDDLIHEEVKVKSK